MSSEPAARHRPTESGEQEDHAELDVSIVLPAYNEELAIGDDLDAIRAAMEATDFRYEIIVVDDGSNDRTAEVVRQRPWARLIQHPCNRGNGAARTTGVRAARGRIIAFTDADRTYPVDQLPAMLRRIEAGADMVIGARKTEAGTWRWLRRPAKWALRRLAEYLTATRIPDLNSGLRVQRRDVTLRYLPLMPTTHSWVSTITIAFLNGGYRVEWWPIDYYPRVGRSTFHPIRDTYNYLSMVVRSVMYFDPLKIFLPLAIALIALGLGKYLLYDILWRFGDRLLAGRIPSMPATTLAVLLTGVQVAVVGLLADLIVRRTRL